MNTVWGVACSGDGTAYVEELVAGLDRPKLQIRAWRTPASEIRSIQPATIIVDENHDGRERGHVIYMERRDGNLWLVAHCDDDVLPLVHVRVGEELRSVEHDLYWSLSRRSTDDWRDIQIVSASFTRSPARLAATPLRFGSGEINRRTGWTHLTGFEKELLNRAAESDLKRHGRPLVVHDHGSAHLSARSAYVETASARSTVETRSATVEAVSTSSRTVEILAAPYGVPARVPLNGKMVEESFATSAFVGVNEQRNRDHLRVWRDHRPELAVGRVTSLDPGDPHGLVAEFRLSKTTLGDETLELAADGVLDASVGFAAIDEQWDPGRSRRRVTRAYLHHLGLTSDPAYAGTHVLDVRGDLVAR